MRSIYDNTKVDGAVAIYGTYSALSQYGSSVDTKGYNSGAIRLQVSQVGATVITIAQNASITAVLEESSDNSTFAAATDNGGTQIGCTATASSAAAVIASARIEGLGLSNRSRYLRIKVTTYATNASRLAADIFTAVAVIELGRAYSTPTTTQSSGGPTGTPATTASNT